MTPPEDLSPAWKAFFFILLSRCFITGGVWQPQAEITAKYFTNPEALSESWSLSFTSIKWGCWGLNTTKTDKAFLGCKMPHKYAVNNLHLT